MPNPLAYLVIAVWPLIAIAFYTKLRPLQATLCTVVGGYMLLPSVATNFDFPLIPALNKETISILSALVGSACISKEKFSLVPKFGIEKWLALIWVLLPFFITVTNQEPYGMNSGLTYYDMVSSMLTNALSIMPFFLGLHYVKTYDDHITLLKWLVLAGIIYSVPALLEVRLSPQLHNWIYGYHPHLFIQQIRGDGFRPVVFMGHGLLVATFFFISIASAVILWKEKIGILGKGSERYTGIIIIYLIFVLILCKTLGALIYCLVFLALMIFMSIKKIKVFIFSLTLLVIIYPFLCILNIFPHQSLIDLAEMVSAERAQSLGFRFFNEIALLEHALDKIVFGWGGWGRFRLEGSITDGFWIIMLGSSGLVGFITIFSFPALNVFRALRISEYLHINRGKRLLIAHALLVAIWMVDQIPNASVSTWSWFIIGSLSGRVYYLTYETRMHNSKNISGVTVS